MIAVTGETYSVRDQLKTLGGQWDSQNKQWLLPDEAKQDIEQIRVPVGGSEQLWEPCSRCGDEPVDGSGLCGRCRGTKSLTVRAVLSDDDQARAWLQDMNRVAMGFYEYASRGAEVSIPIDTHVIGKGSPFSGGYHVELVTDGISLYALHVHHYEGDRDRAYLVDPSKLQSVYRRVVELAVRGEIT